MSSIQMRSRAAKPLTAVFFFVQALRHSDVCLVGRAALFDQVHRGTPLGRMLKKVAYYTRPPLARQDAPLRGFVLGSKQSSTYPRKEPVLGGGWGLGG
jgi:hypothetical protein